MYLLYQGSNLVPQSRSQNFLRFIAAHSLWAHNRSHSISVINSSRNVRRLRRGRTASRRSSVRPSFPPLVAVVDSQLHLQLAKVYCACTISKEGVICCPVSRTHAFISRRSSILWRMLQSCSRLEEQGSLHNGTSSLPSNLSTANSARSDAAPS